MKARRLIVAVLGIFMLILVGWQVALFVSRVGLVRLVIVCVPSDSTIALDGKAVQPGTIYVSPGAHHLKAVRTYFSPATLSLNTSDLDNTHTVYLLPYPSTPEAIRWLDEHQEEQQQREAYGGLQADKAQQTLTKLNPIIDKLPVYNFRYRIDYSIGQNNKLAFLITLYPSGSKDSAEYKEQLQMYRDEALSFMRSNGADPSTQTITYSPALE